jgi:competence protein ComEC
MLILICYSSAMKIFYFFIFLIIGLIFLKSSFSGDAELIFFDVGQGDAFVFRTPKNKIILIDGGPDWSPLYYLGKWLGFRKKEIDILILSHGHADHISSLPEILKRYKVENIFLPPGIAGFSSEALLTEAKDSTIFYPQEDVCYHLEDDCNLCVFPPAQKFIDASDENDLSLAVSFHCVGLSVFGAGDAGKKRERSFLLSNFFQPVKVLKVSHHGSDTSSDIDFLTALQPSLALVSVGLDNHFGHPHQAVINRLLKMNINIWRTDRVGHLKIISNNSQIYYSSK